MCLLVAWMKKVLSGKSILRHAEIRYSVVGTFQIQLFYFTFVCFCTKHDIGHVHRGMYDDLIYTLPLIGFTSDLLPDFLADKWCNSIQGHFFIFPLNQINSSHWKAAIQWSLQWDMPCESYRKFVGLERLL